MAASNIIVWLRRVSFLKNLSLGDLHQLARLMQRQRWAPGQVIVAQNQPGTTFHIVERGYVRVTETDAGGASRTVAYLGEGQFFGESILVSDRYDQTVDAVVPTDTLVIEKAEWQPWLEAHRRVADGIRKESAYRRRLSARTFPGLLADEIAVLIVRRHWWTLAQRIGLIVGLMIAAGLAVFVLQISMGLVLLDMLIFLFLLAALVWFVIDWSNDYFIVTNRRVMHVEKTLFFFEEITEATLDKIQNVSIVTPGLLNRLFDFHDLMVQTAATGPLSAIRFTYIPHARQVRDVIFEQKGLWRFAEQVQVAQQREEILRDKLGLASPPQPPPIVVPPPPNRLDSLFKSLQRARSYFWPQTRLEAGGMVIWRKHWYIFVRNWGWWLIPVWGVLLALFLLLLVSAVFGRPLHLGEAHGLALSLMFLIVPGISGFLWWEYEDWRNDIYVLTDDSIIDVERLPLGLREESRKAGLEQIQDMRVTVPSLTAHVFRFGDVIIQTAGAVGEFTFNSVPNPHAVRDEISARIERFRSRPRQEEAARRQGELVEWLAAYHKITRGSSPGHST